IVVFVIATSSARLTRSRQHGDFPIGVPSTGHVAIYTLPPFAILTRCRGRRKSSVWSVFRDRCHRELMTPVYTGGASSYGAARLVWHCHQGQPAPRCDICHENRVRPSSGRFVRGTLLSDRCSAPTASPRGTRLFSAWVGRHLGPNLCC